MGASPVGRHSAHIHKLMGVHRNFYRGGQSFTLLVRQWYGD